jgi:hypothetical protein
MKCTLTFEGTLSEVEIVLQAIRAHQEKAPVPVVPVVSAAEPVSSDLPPKDMVAIATENVPIATEAEQVPDKKYKFPAPLTEKPTQKRKHRKKTPAAVSAPKAGEPTPEVQTQPDTPSAQDKDSLPSLDILKNAVIAAVKKARANGGGGIVDHLPEFFNKTGLPFVMESQEEHKQALADLLAKAGIKL